jgi:hypothetical protein
MNLGTSFGWAEYYEARNKGDRQGLQAAELLADAVAIRTMVVLGMDPALLMNAVRKINRYNGSHGSRSTNQGNYPSEKERAHFHRSIAQLISARAADSSRQAGQ